MQIPRTSFLALALALGAPISAQDVATSSLFEVPRSVSSAVQQTLLQYYDVLHPVTAGEPLRVIVTPGELGGFRTLVPSARFIRSGRPFKDIRAEWLKAAPEPPDPLYFTVPEVIAEIDQQVANFPALARKIDITALPGGAKTHNGQGIFGLKVSDNVGQDEDEPAIFLAAQHHARELNSTYMVIGAMRRILTGYGTDPAITALVDNYELYFVPTVNPDGVDHVWNVDDNWRKNRRNNGGSFGVDNNRNYPFLWGLCGASTTASSQTYRGPSAASEPETQSMRALVRAVRPEIYLDFHSSGREVLFSYAPCATVNPTIASFINTYVDDLRTPMSFNTRNPSASGEAPEDFWANGGTLSFLTEVGTSFQPAFSSTVTEEARVWPGIRQAVTNWRPAVRGHVRSIYQSQPIEATITFTPNVFNHGEQTLSRARDGRYGLWLPVGTWQVTWSATGFKPVTKSVTVSSLNNPATVEIDMEPAWSAATLTASGSNRIGTTTSLTYASPGDAGLVFWIALSGGTSPGITLGSRTLPLNADALFISSLSAAPLLTGNLGALPGSAQATAQLNIPNVPVLAGFTIYTAGITFEKGYPSGVKKWSPARSITILP